MKTKNVIDYVDRVKPNGFDIASKLVWLEEVEGLVEVEIRKKEHFESGMSLEEELSVCAPHNRIYALYLFSMIDLLSENYDSYRASHEAFEEAFSLYGKWEMRQRRVRASRDGG